jgi:DUF971 family protein
MRELKSFHEAEPKSMEWLDGGHVGITWDDGSRFEYTRSFLREHCPCATCKGTHGDPTTLVTQAQAQAAPAEPPAGKKAVFAIRSGPKPPTIVLSTKLESAEPVGAYAIRFQWGDGHGSGIYSWRYMRFLGEVLAHRATVAEFL